MKHLWLKLIQLQQFQMTPDHNPVVYSKDWRQGSFSSVYYATSSFWLHFCSVCCIPWSEPKKVRIGLFSKSLVTRPTLCSKGFMKMVFEINLNAGFSKRNSGSQHSHWRGFLTLPHLAKSDTLWQNLNLPWLMVARGSRKNSPNENILVFITLLLHH